LSTDPATALDGVIEQYYRHTSFGWVRHAYRPKGRNSTEDRGRRPRRVTLRTMKYRISTENGFLRADLLDRETADETRMFLQAVVLASINHRCSRVLVHVRLSKPLFTVERHGVLRTLKRIASDPTHKIALLGDTVELGMSHDYVSLLGRQQGISLRSFQREADAVEWLKDRRRGEERRQPEQAFAPLLERREGERRKNPGSSARDLTNSK
jgi:hypothetical protein